LVGVLLLFDFLKILVLVQRTLHYSAKIKLIITKNTRISFFSKVSKFFLDINKKNSKNQFPLVWYYDIYSYYQDYKDGAEDAKNNNNSLKN
jgi:hypothetical protein